MQSRTGPLACLNAPSTPNCCWEASGKGMALAVEWLPEEWPDGVPSVKQLLVVGLLLIPMLLHFAAELTLFVLTSALPIGQPIPFEQETPQVKS